MSWDLAAEIERQREDAANTYAAVGSTRRAREDVTMARDTARRACSLADISGSDTKRWSAGRLAPWW